MIGDDELDTVPSPPPDDCELADAYHAARQAEAEAVEELASCRELIRDCVEPLTTAAMRSETEAVRGRLLALVRRCEIKCKATKAESGET